MNKPLNNVILKDPRYLQAWQGNLPGLMEAPWALQSDGGYVLRDPSGSTVQGAAIRSLVSEYANQAAIWYSGEVNSVVTPSVVCNGDLTTALDQPPLKWIVTIDPADDNDAAQQLMDAGPNVVTIYPGGVPEYKSVVDLANLPKVFTRIYAVCKSSAAVPADYTGGAYIVSDLERDIAKVLAAMVRWDFSAGLGATEFSGIASQVYQTYKSQLTICGGVRV